MSISVLFDTTMWLVPQILMLLHSASIAMFRVGSIIIALLSAKKMRLSKPAGLPMVYSELQIMKVFQYTGQEQICLLTPALPIQKSLIQSI